MVFLAREAAAVGLLLVVGASAVPCPNETAFDWCNTALPLARRVDLLVANLSREEKAQLFASNASAIERIGWPKYNWWSESLHGVARDGMATSFPQIGLVACSMNRTLWHAMGDTTSTEGRGKNNPLLGGLYQGLTFWAPNVNIYRDPRWGRGQETPGEDPTINSEYAAAFVSGMQGDEAANGYLKVSACLKHYAAYSLEGDCPGPSCRESFPAVVTAQDMEDTYLPAFQAGVERGRASGLMCSYNAETYGYGTMGNGTQGGAVPSCANKYIMNDLARDEWGFDGYITSDCNAVNDVWNGGADASAGGHHYVDNAPDTVKATLSAGMDTDCHGSMQKGRGLMTPTLMLKLLETDPAVEAMGDTALKHLFAVQFRLGFADPVSKVPWATWDEAYVNTPAAQQLAAEAASQSIVLLKNDARTLPLKGVGKTMNKAMTVAVLGRNANATSNMQGNYFGTAPFLISPVTGIDNYAATVYSDGVDTEAAVKMVADADAVVLVVGLLSDCSLEGKRAPGAACALGKSDEAEGHDRTSLLLPGNQDALITDVATAASKKRVPVVLVVMSGGQVDISEHQNNPHIGAIVWCGYPGQSGGAAIADVIFGKTNPAGRLTLTWYREEFTKQVEATDMGMRPNKSTGNPGRSYRFFTGEPLYHFGHGLSFTSFEHKLVVVGPATLDSSVIEAAGREQATTHGAGASETSLSLSLLSKTTVLSLQCNTTNVGDYDGAEAIMLFAAPPGAGAEGRPLKSLVDFDRVFLQKSSSATTRFDIMAQHLTVATAQGESAVRREAARGSWKFWVGVDGQDDAVTLNVL